MNHKLEFLNIDLILPTEHILAANLVNVKLNIFRDGAIKVPLCVEKTHKVLMDGHHRLEILKELGCPVAPVVFFDYEEVIVVEWEDRSKRIPPSEIINRGLRGNLYPPKSTKHLFPIELNCNVLLEELQFFDMPLSKISLY